MTIDQMLEEARTQIDRMYVFELPEAVARGAIVVDIRPQAQRVVEGTLPGALAIERNVLEWRLDPTSSAHLALAVNHDVEWIIVCSEGYTSSLAAASLQQLGLHKATDLVGGYKAIKAAGLLGALIGSQHCTRELATVSAH
ncbi:MULTISPECIES: rhodanese-like domain-containing protein [Rhodococcus]|uniref:Rhodanese-like domain-containing protein n=1 Tax=Rhodococcus oxybenzonivorans TaxID=1990687 RepID=A0AAE5A618_9NOCA|nr:MULTISPECIES: rhodanese-like domain-containing protein [Rhodococcus]MDV7246673.1 rhodanese-like domain-containing protein [Rhodococcus oxybenzonivorans]MDV7265041.1 rhodanese-like domain-containing protein [Rhodococcus oxybenzonivorans]MDV7278296.1 rhodanese-like domain-containing protein [Rhodococcus oxybenzonivorans]MDV7337685.1 rhodanese-like domain-containing protein [Rhodococcus oxybenzonivorans]MDV7347949.1 rhodanese-like domain-containing protein [Rhodococcus oxybenzonivorans]